MESKVALLAVLAEDSAPKHEINMLLHEFSDAIIGRMGIPYREKNISVISIVLDAPADEVNALAGRLGRIRGVTAKAVYAGK